MYEFKGFFVRDAQDIEPAIRSRWPDLQIKRLTEPFSGIGVRVRRIEVWGKEDQEEKLDSFERELLEWSSTLPSHRFVFVSVECWGGDCAYQGFVFQNGGMISQESGENALQTLLEQIGVTLDERGFFLPFTRTFPW